MHVKRHTGVEDQRHDVDAQAKRAVDPATCTPVGRLISSRHHVLLVLFLLVTIPSRLATGRSDGECVFMPCFSSAGRGSPSAVPGPWSAAAVRPRPRSWTSSPTRGTSPRR